MHTDVIGLLIEAIQKMSSVRIFRSLAMSVLPTASRWMIAILGGDERHDAGRFAFIDKLLHARRDGRKTIRLLRGNEQRRQRRNGQFVV